MVHRGLRRARRRRGTGSASCSRTASAVSADSFDPAIVAALQGDGYYVLRDSVPGVDSVAVRAAALAPEIDAFIAANQLDRVHIFAHSMGGLDARYLISTLHYA